VQAALGFTTMAITLTAIGCGPTPAPARFSDVMAPYRNGTRIVVVGDAQRTAPILEVWREQNDRERERVFAAIASERPDLLLLAGDNVFNGASGAQWRSFDRLTRAIRESNIPAASAFGNHEYWLGRAAAEAHLFPRFPLNASRHWFTLPVGPLRIVVIDSNKRGLGADWTEQLRWYTYTLEAFDRDGSVRGVLVLVHHPPFTNSTVTSDELHVQRELVPAFAGARKTLAMLSGHVHSYERFTRGGKNYVVSGGGGGPRARLLVGDARRHKDDRYDGPSLRNFNFAVYTLTDSGVTAEVRGLAKGAETWTVLDRFDLPFAE
jgi:3',5'-cyclic AMP phosphodiesterase CpdA